MASIKKKSSGGGGANWMDTYGDMVTLLLCFFVLLYSISTIDQQKWMIVVRSFNRDAMVQVDPEDPNGPEGSAASSGGDGLPALAEIEEDITELYDFLKNLESAQGDGSITVSKGDGYVFISFNDAIFFGGDSAVLRQGGKDILDQIIPKLDDVGPSIDELRVIGHTAQAGNTPNPTLNDRILSSSRAATVVAYMQDRIPDERLAPARMIAEGLGQWRNAAPNDTEENKAKNRRVEMIITGRGVDGELRDSLKEYDTKLESSGILKVTG